MLNFLLESATTSGSAEGAAKTQGNTWWIYVVLLVLVAAMLILPSITQRRNMKKYDEMVNQLHVGDTIRTVGGVVGRITKISEKDGYKTFILETGAKNTKTTMEFDINAVGAVLKSSYKPEPAKEENVKEEKAEETKAEEVKTEEPKSEEVKAEEKVEEVKETEPAKKPAKKVKKTSKK